MSWSDHPDNDGNGWIAVLAGFILLIALIVVGINAVNGYDRKKLEPYRNHVFYCPSCLVLYGKNHHEEYRYVFGWQVVERYIGTCPEDGDKLIPTRYKTLEEYKKGTWTPARR